MYFEKLKFLPQRAQGAQGAQRLCILWLIILNLTATCTTAVEPETRTDKDTILIDRIAAVVDDEIITLTDIDKAVQICPGFKRQQESEDEFYARVLQDLINYKVVYLEYRNDFELQEEDYAEVQTAVIEKFGSLDKLMSRLHTFDMDWSDFKAYIREKVVYEKVLQKRLQVKITINFKEIETFYYNEYLPQQERVDLKPLSLIEMFPRIENHLRKVRTQQNLAQWLAEIRSSYKIENKLIKEK
jgi:peptidyl-prolyl cis-trans isomerase SurA